MRQVNSWSDITVGQYQEMNMIQSESQVTKFIEMMSIALDCDPQEIRDLPISEYKTLQEKMQFISKEPDLDIRKTFEINGKKYGLIPDMNLITGGEFLDAEQFKLDPMANLHYTLALIYRPVISEDEDSYKIAAHKSEGFEFRAELFRDELSIEIVLGAVLFFSLLVMESSIDLLASLEKELMKQNQIMKTMTTPAPTKKKRQKRFKSNGDYTTNSTD